MNKMFWFCLLAMVVIAGCKKDQCDDFSNYFPIEDVAKPYLFKEGSYWIYQNSVTGTIDSEYISSTKNYLDTNYYMKYTCGSNYTVSEVMRMTHRSGILQNDSFIWFSAGVLINPFLGAEKDSKINVILFLENKTTPITGGCFSYKGFNDKLSISGNVFNSVDCFAMKSDSGCNSIFDYTTDFYFAPHFGLIKKIEYNTPNGTQEWNLIRWNIIQ